MFEPILLTQQEYINTAFVFIIIGLLLTAKILFTVPHEREKQDDDEFF